MKKITILLAVLLSLSMTPQPQLTMSLVINQTAKISKVQGDGSGNVIITGLFNSAVDFDPTPANSILIPIGNSDVFLAKYDSLGSLLWAFNLGAASCVGTVNDLTIDTLNNIYLSGGFNGCVVDFSHGTGTHTLLTSGYLVKYDSLGDFKWVKGVESSALTVNNHNHLVAATVTTPFSGFKVLEFDSMGAPLSTLSFSATSINCVVRKVLFNTSGEMYLVGSLDQSLDLDPGTGNVTISGNDIFFGKYSSSGAFLFGSKAGVSYGTAQDIYLDQYSNIYLTGYDQNYTSTYNVHLSKWSSAGSLLWFNNLASLQNSSTVKSQGLKFVKDCNGTLQLIGVYTDNCAIWDKKFVFSSVGSSTLRCAASCTTGQQDQLFIADVNTSMGTLTNVHNIGNISFSSTYKINPCVFSTGALFVSGLVSGNLDFSGVSTYSASGAFLVKYQNCPSLTLGITENIKNTQILPYPNPAKDNITVFSAKRIIIRDVMGKVIIESDQGTLDVSGLARGLYVVEAELKSGKVVSKFIKD